MSFRSRIRVSAEPAGDLDLGFLSGAERGVFEDLEHAHDAVHGGADLVAHRSQKIAFGLIGGFGAGLFLAEGEDELFVFENEAPEAEEVGVVEFGGVEQEEGVGDGDQRQRPTAGLGERGEAAE
jgi:hypothetical protein